MLVNSIYNLKRKLEAGKRLFGPLIGPGSNPEKTIKSLQQLGTGFVMLDTEHSLINKETIWEYICVCREMDMPLFIRTEDKASFFRYYLDAGIKGLILPLVNTVEEVAHAVDMSYFPPIGHRGSSIGMSPYLIDYQDITKIPFCSLMDYINNNTMLFPQTETLENISNLHRILSMEGVSGTLVGTFDLAISMGNIDPKAVATEVVTSSAIEGKLKQVLQICQQVGKIAGVGGLPPRAMARWAKEGYSLLFIGYILNGNIERLRPSIEELRTLIG